MTSSKDFLVAIQNFEISANFGKNFRLAANYVRLKIWSVFELEPFFYVKSKFHIHFWDGVLDYMAEIQFRSFLPIASIDIENGLQNSQVSTSLVFYISLMMENKIMLTFNSLEAIKNDQNLAKISQN